MELTIALNALKWKAIATLLLIGIGVAGPALAVAEECGNDIRACERPRTGVVIRNVKTSGVGHMAPGFIHSEHPCNQFKLSLDQVRHYLLAAGQITQNDMQYIVDQSACVVTGVVKFSNGISHPFVIGELREGRIGGTGKEPEYLYCSACPSPPFAR